MPFAVRASSPPSLKMIFLISGMATVLQPASISLNPIIAAVSHRVSVAFIFPLTIHKLPYNSQLAGILRLSVYINFSLERLNVIFVCNAK